MLALVSGAACASPPRRTDLEGGALSKLEPDLRRAIPQLGDSPIGVLVRTLGPPDAEQRNRLEAAGLRVGSVAGDVVTGRIQASALKDLVKLPFVTVVQRARRVPLTTTGQ